MKTSSVLLGIEMGEDAYTLQHLSVNPSFRGEGIGKAMVEKIQEQFPDKECQSTDITDAFLKKCTSKDEGGADDYKSALLFFVAYSEEYLSGLVAYVYE